MVPLTGDVLNATPPHATSDIGVTLARGLIVTVNWNVAPLPQAAVFGVTVYVALCAVFSGLVRVPNRLPEPDTAVPPVIPPVTIGADQLYVVPAGTTPLVPLTGVIVNKAPLQLTRLIAVSEATGLTVKVNWNDAPAQPPEIGVTV